MKPTIKSIKRGVRGIELTFERDKDLVRLIEKTFQLLLPNFALQDDRKTDFGSGDLWQREKRNTNFGYTLLQKQNFVRLKVLATSGFVDEFLDLLAKHVQFSSLSPNARRRCERTGVLAFASSKQSPSIKKASDKTLARKNSS